MRWYEITGLRINTNLLMEKQVWERSTTCPRPHWVSDRTSTTTQTLWFKTQAPFTTRKHQVVATKSKLLKHQGLSSNGIQTLQISTTLSWEEQALKSENYRSYLRSLVKYFLLLWVPWNNQPLLLLCFSTFSNLGTTGLRNFETGKSLL